VTPALGEPPTVTPSSVSRVVSTEAAPIVGSSDDVVGVSRSSFTKSAEMGPPSVNRMSCDHVGGYHSPSYRDESPTTDPVIVVTPAETIASARRSIEVTLNFGYSSLEPRHQLLLSNGSPEPTRYRFPSTVPPARAPWTPVW